MKEKINEVMGLLKQIYDILNELQVGEIRAASVIAEPQEQGSFYMDTIKGDQWPEAANPKSICNRDNEADKINRAKGIVNLMIEDNLTGKKFLDFGCGEGHMALEAAETAAYSVGYDIHPNNWNKLPQKPNLFLTESWDEMKRKGPYNVILMFDVLDHADVDKGMDAPGELLKRVADELLLPNGKIYLRCHPWISRHGTHLYNDVNKAYAHVVLTQDELLSMGMNMGIETHKVIMPLRTYRGWIDHANLQLENERAIKEPLEPFFKTPKIAKRIIENCQLIENGQLLYPEFQMTILFMDFILTKKS